MKALLVPETGGAAAITTGEVADAQVKPGHVLVRVAATGINFADVMILRGQAPPPSPVLGVEGAGTVEAVGDGVTDIAVGDRVAWPLVPGSHAELVTVPAALAAPVPDDVDFQTAAAVVAQGMTAQYLADGTFPLGPEHTVLIQAGATGVGRILVQIAKARGTRVLATASTAEKRQAIAAAGAEALKYEGFGARAKELTDGVGVDVAFDGVGKTTFADSLAATRRKGTVVLYGASSGMPEPMNPMALGQAGALFLTVPTFADYVSGRDALVTGAESLFDLVRTGAVTAGIDTVAPWSQAADAYRRVDDRQVAGKIVLTPGD